MMALGMMACPVLLAEQEGAAGTPWAEIGITGLNALGTGDDPATAGLLLFDVAVGLRARGGAFALLIEAESRPHFGAWQTAAPSIGGTLQAGAASDGAAWLTDFRYSFPSASGVWSIGFLESKSFIDASAVANDDKTQFAHPAFVHNPNIDLPGSSLGLAWQSALRPGGQGYTAVLSVGEGRAGFIALERFQECRGMVARLGAWRSGASAAPDIGGPASRGSHGLYASLDGQLAAVRWNLRLGIAQPSRHGLASFLGVAAELPLARATLGVALGQSRRHSGRLPEGSGPSSHLELYYRRLIGSGLVITPSLQFSDGPGSSQSGLLTAGIRIRFSI
jgi:hypothetical protein